MTMAMKKIIGVWVAAQMLMALAAQQAFAADSSCSDYGSCPFTYTGPFDCCATVPDKGCCQYKCYSCDYSTGGIQRYGTYHNGYIWSNSGGLCHP